MRGSAPRGRRIQAFPWDEITAPHDVATRVSLGGGDGLSFKVCERTYRPTDARIAGDPLKAASSAMMDGTGGDVLWLETAGVADIGGALGPPTGSAILGVQPQAGVDLSGLVLFRTLRPCLVPSNGSAPETLHHAAAELPFSPDTAILMPAGSEFEIIGQMSLGVKVGVGAGLDAALGGVSGGASSTILASTSAGKEVALRVTGLGDGKVGVAVLDARRLSGNLNVIAQASLSLPRDVGGVSCWLEVDAQKRPSPAHPPGLGDLARAVVRRLGASVEVGVKRTDSHEVLDGFVLDLSNPDARSAYQELVQFSTDKAAGCAVRTGTGVSRARIDEEASLDEKGGSMKAFGHTLVMDQAINASSSGAFLGPNGESIAERKMCFEHHSSNPLGGARRVRWEAVSMTIPGKGEPESYFSMDFEATRESVAVDKFLRFAGELGISFNVTSAGGSLSSTPDVNRRWCREAQVKASVFFTPEGVKRIDRATGAQGETAYLDALLALKPERGGQLRWARDGERDRARAFGRQVAALSCGQETAGEFFRHIGQVSGFDYMASILALAKIAGPSGILVHALSMKGNSLSLESTDRGHIEHTNLKACASGHPIPTSQAACGGPPIRVITDPDPRRE